MVAPCLVTPAQGEAKVPKYSFTETAHSASTMLAVHELLHVLPGAGLLARNDVIFNNCVRAIA